MARLTGRRRFRETLRGKQVLQVEIEQTFAAVGTRGPVAHEIRKSWRDATTSEAMDELSMGKSDD